jgi:hypothetical protein
MPWANSGAAGLNFAVTTNWTPPTSSPGSYPNLAERAAAIPNVPTIFVGGGTIHNLATRVPKSSGDSAGALGGVVSGTVSSMSRNVAGANTVLIAGMPATRMTDPTQQNNGNTIGMGISPSQMTVQTLAR